MEETRRNVIEGAGARERYRRSLLAIYLVGLLGLTLSPIPVPPEFRQGSDKVVHMALYGGLALLLYWNLSGSGRRYLVVLVAGLSLGADGLIELLQGLLPYRSAEFWDFLFGMVGAVAGTAVAHVARARGRRNRAESI